MWSLFRKIVFFLCLHGSLPFTNIQTCEYGSETNSQAPLVSIKLRTYPRENETTSQSAYAGNGTPVSPLIAPPNTFSVPQLPDEPKESIIKTPVCTSSTWVLKLKGSWYRGYRIATHLITRWASSDTDHMLRISLKTIDVPVPVEDQHLWYVFCPCWHSPRPNSLYRQYVPISGWHHKACQE